MQLLIVVPDDLGFAPPDPRARLPLFGLSARARVGNGDRDRPRALRAAGDEADQPVFVLQKQEEIRFRRTIHPSYLTPPCIGANSE